MNQFNQLTPEEMIDIVDEQDVVLYQEKKMVAHQKGLLHRTVIGGVRDSQGHWVVVQQASGRQDAGQFVNPVGGHVQAGESNEEALKREALEEIGFNDFEYKYVGKFIFNREVIGRNEHHYFIVYEIYTDKELRLSHEAVAYRAFSPQEYVQQLKENPVIFGAAHMAVLRQLYPELLP
jgi:isopentenyl-diphosphate delta-isomerase